MTPKTENRKPKTGVHASPERAEADQLLAEFDRADREVKRLETEAAAALATVQQEWADKLQPAKILRASLDEILKDLMKEHQADFFAVDGLGSCSLDLPHGALLYDRSDYVVKPRKVDVLAALSRYGFEEAIRRTAAVDWEVLANKEEWPDEVLAIIGTRREVKETFAYELSAFSDQPSAKSKGKEGA